MIKKIERPEVADWEESMWFNLWFDDNIKSKHFYDPKDVVEVYCWRAKNDKKSWLADQHDNITETYSDWGATYKALLINIEPIKHETCADVLRDLLAKDRAHMELDNRSLLKRAKAALEREDNG